MMTLEKLDRLRSESTDALTHARHLERQYGPLSISYITARMDYVEKHARAHRAVLEWIKQLPDSSQPATPASSGP